MDHSLCLAISQFNYARGRSFYLTNHGTRVTMKTNFRNNARHMRKTLRCMGLQSYSIYLLTFLNLDELTSSVDAMQAMTRLYGTVNSLTACQGEFLSRFSLVAWSDGNRDTCLDCLSHVDCLLISYFALSRGRMTNGMNPLVRRALTHTHARTHAYTNTQSGQLSPEHSAAQKLT